ncbi:hypothetical protein D6D24_00887 [Aureobasidium pullulans]|uniref:Phosphoribosylaminoimidazole-succinocarboxamide synthase n=1 Tax=Aureobasidium pullulans TaxID=5580 RepID=A0A4S8WBJ2_AURPU|nr:hypothetical protein D6D24_00887 [Aureobasidium pullulans]
MSRSLESLHLKHTNVSQPRLERTYSERSFTASEDYYSLSSRSSNRSDSRASQSRPYPLPRTHSRSIRRIESPASPDETSRQSYEGIARPVLIRQVSKPASRPMRGVGVRRRDLGPTEVSVPPIPPRRGSPIKRKPVPSTVFESPPRLEPIRIPQAALSSASMQIARQSDPPTPEADTPYVRFAIDQITRDEDVAEGKPWLGPEFGHGYDEGPIPLNQEYPPIPDDPYDDISPIPIPPRSPRRKSSAIPAPHPLQQTVSLLTPFEPSTDSFYAPLNALPPILRPLRFGIFIALLTLYLIALVFTAIWSRVRTGLCNYGTFGDGTYFVFQYLPTLLGMVLLLWLFEIEKAVYRIAPFIALASKTTSIRGHGTTLPMYPSGFILPSLVHLRAGQRAIGAFLITSWLTLFTIPLLASSFNVYYRGTPGRWVWLATQGTIWTAIVLYILLLVASVVLLLFLHSRRTGLKWDSRTLADLIVITERSNILDHFADIGVDVNKYEIWGHSAERQDRLGYFNTAYNPNDVFHTLGAPNRPARPYSADESILNEKFAAQPTGYSNINERPYSYGSTGTHNTTDLVLQPDNTDNYLPWFLRTGFAFIWLVIALLLLLAFLVVSYLPATAVSAGFLPDLPETVNRLGFSSSNFLYSFVPALLGLLCLLVWQPIDLAFRRLQPYASMSSAGGCLAEKSLLLSYPADAPFVVTLKAAVNGHVRVAMISIVTILAALLPVLAGGVFWNQFYVAEQRIRVSAQMSAFYPLTVFVVLYALAYTLVFAGHKRALPNRGITLADNISLLHQSRLLNDAAFQAPATKTALVTRLLSAPVGERISIHQNTGPEGGVTGSKVSIADSIRGLGRARADATTPVNNSGGSGLPHYGYGKYYGRDGKQHIGVDRVGRPGIPDMVIRM